MDACYFYFLHKKFTFAKNFDNLKLTEMGLRRKKDGSFDLRFKGSREAQGVEDENMRKGRGCLFVLIFIGVLIALLLE
jgi:hypothetical protein